MTPNHDWTVKTEKGRNRRRKVMSPQGNAPLAHTGESTVSNKPKRHEKTRQPPHAGELDRPGPSESDLKRNPGIGASKGGFATGESPENIQGDNAVEGDVGNDAMPAGGINPRQTGRTNKCTNV